MTQQAMINDGGEIRFSTTFPPDKQREISQPIIIYECFITRVTRKKTLKLSSPFLIRARRERGSSLELNDDLIIHNTKKENKLYPSHFFRHQGKQEQRKQTDLKTRNSPR